MKLFSKAEKQHSSPIYYFIICYSKLETGDISDLSKNFVTSNIIHSDGRKFVTMECITMILSGFSFLFCFVFK